MQPSETAQFAAAHRAYHTMHDRPVLLEDQPALWLLGPQLRTVLRVPPLRWLFWRPLVNKLRPMSTFIVVRSRYTEDALAEAVRGDCRQYVILGAGLDSWALRNEETDVRVFELDQPATQQWKADRIREKRGGLPEQLVLAPIDLESESVAEVLPKHGFDTQALAFVSWLGTICYLSREAVAETFASLAAVAAPGSRITFDYFQPRASMSPADRQLFEILNAGGTRRGEPIQTFLNAEEMAAVLLEAGFQVVEDLSAAEIRDRYLVKRSDGLDVPGFVRLGCAELTKRD